MNETTQTVKLKTGETMTVQRLEAPCGPAGDRLVEFMYVRHPEYTNCSWHHNCRRIVAGEFADVSRDVFFAGSLGDDLVGTTWYGAPRDTGEVGTFGRVITAVEHRRKGISTVLCQLALDDFAARGGQVMHLGTSLNNPAHQVYEAIGYRHYNFIEGNGTIMRAVLQGGYDDFERVYFAPGRAVSQRRLHWGDLARAELLYNLPHWFLKDYTQGIFGHVPFEGQFFELMAPLDRGEAGLTLTTDDERLVGLAYAAPVGAGGGAQGHVRVLEFLVHPHYAEAGAGLLEAVAAQTAASRLLAYASALDVQKCETLEEAGFEREAVLASVLQDEASEFDMYVYGRE